MEEGIEGGVRPIPSIKVIRPLTAARGDAAAAEETWKPTVMSCRLGVNRVKQGK